MSTGTAGASKTGFPRLIELINVDGWPRPPVLGSKGALAIIADRLRGGLDPLWEVGERWNQWDGRFDIYDHQRDWGERVHRAGLDPRALLEERWARAISELLVAAPYNGPDVATGIPLATLYERFTDASDPVVAITVACQMAVTYAVLSRGHTMADVAGVGIDCGDQSALPVFAGRWRKGPTNDFQTAYSGEPPMRPGSVHGWIALDGTTKLSGSHTVFMLRTDPARSAAGSTGGGNKAQVLDTGAALNFSAKPRALEGFPKQFGTFDYAETTSVRATITGGSYEGMGVPQTTDVQLAAAVKRMGRTRPLGLVRLVLARTPFDDKDVETVEVGGTSIALPKNAMYIGPVCRMWGAEPTANYSIARHHFAIRSLPDWDPPSEDGTRSSATLGFLLFSTPKGLLAERLLSARDTSLAEAHELPDVDVDAQRRLLMIIRSTEDDRSEVRWVHQSTAFGQRGDVPTWLKLVDALPFDATFSRVPFDVPPELGDGVETSVGPT